MYSITECMLPGEAFHQLRVIAWAGLCLVVLGCCFESACSSAASERAKRADDRKSPIRGETVNDTDRLEQLRLEREEGTFADKLAIGAGDLIEVSVPGVPELNRFKVRVSEDNTISVPLAGVVPVGGMSEQELRHALYERLAKPMKNPDVEVFVDHYQSRDVAVVGMVQKAGLYSITSRADTLLTMINRAGGMTERASSRVLFIPASAAPNPYPLALAKGLSASGTESLGEVQPVRADLDATERQPPEPPDRISPTRVALMSSADQTAMLSLVGTIDPIEIDLTTARNETELAIRARPGDTLIVPAAGEVMVDGWVRNPGAFRIVPGMTVVSAVAAAGGALFSHRAELLRTDTDGTRRATRIDLGRVKGGTDPDIPVEEGDVVVVQHSSVGAVPYALYEIFTKFGTGMYLPMP